MKMKSPDLFSSKMQELKTRLHDQKKQKKLCRQSRTHNASSATVGKIHIMLKISVQGKSFMLYDDCTVGNKLGPICYGAISMMLLK